MPKKIYFTLFDKNRSTLRLFGTFWSPHKICVVQAYIAQDPPTKSKSLPLLAHMALALFGLPFARLPLPPALSAAAACSPACALARPSLLPKASPPRDRFLEGELGRRGAAARSGGRAGAFAMSFFARGSCFRLVMMFPSDGQLALPAWRVRSSGSPRSTPGTGAIGGCGCHALFSLEGGKG